MLDDMSIRHIIFDCDGVLTDNTIMYGNGEMPFRARTFYIPDGQGIIMLRERDIEVYLISGEGDSCISGRAEELGVHYELLVQDKGKIFEMLGINPEECAYMGDDVNDLPAMKLAKIVACPVNSHREVIDYISDKAPYLEPGAPIHVKKQIRYRANSSGGHGAVREFCDMLLRNNYLLGID